MKKAAAVQLLVDKLSWFFRDGVYLGGSLDAPGFLIATSQELMQDLLDGGMLKDVDKSSCEGHSPTGCALCILFPMARTSSIKAAASACRCEVTSTRMISAVFLAHGREPSISL